MPEPCKYVYGRNHEDVKAGRVAVGTQCSAYAVGDRGFCFNHLASQGLLTPEEAEKYKDSQAIAASKRREVAKEKRAEARGEDIAGYTLRVASALKDFTSIPDFSLQDFFELIGGIGVGATDAAYKRKFALAHWLIADPSTREPKEVYDVAKILGCSTKYIHECMRGSRMETFISEAREQILLQKCEPRYLAWISAGVEDGDKDAIKAFEKLREKNAAKTSKVSQDIPEDVLNEAEKINANGGGNCEIADAVGWGEEDDVL